MSVRIRTTPDSRDYEIVIDAGVSETLAEHVVRAAPAHAYAIIADSNVAHLHGERALRSLERAGARVDLLSFPAGEAHKNVESWTRLSDQLIRKAFSRDGCIVALGGGVTTDLAGFVAATFMRGVPIVHVPTSLLAMIDAAIGGKTGIDAPAGKNLIGAFHQPNLVLIDPHFLRTLPERELRFGLAEALKHGAIADADFLAWVTASMPPILAHKTHTLTSLITRSVEIKAAFVSEDVHERGARVALNFGHTIAHALERVTQYECAHGDAVALGMLVESLVGELAGVTETGAQATLARALRAAGLPRHAPSFEADAVLDATRSDKKTRGQKQHYALLERIGTIARHDGAWTMPVDDEVVREALMRVSAVMTAAPPV